MESVTDILEAVAVASGSKTTTVSVSATTPPLTPVSRNVTLRCSRKPLSIIQYSYGEPLTYDSVLKTLILSPAIFVPQVSMLAFLVNPFRHTRGVGDSSSTSRDRMMIGH